MLYNELRKDYLLDRWVVIATERSRRPTDFAKTRTSATSNCVCPMCVGNENMTPPATLLYLKNGEKIVSSRDPSTGERPKNWLIRCFPNLYPAFKPPKRSSDREKVFFSENFGSAIGHHEVIVETPNHDEFLSDAPLSQFELMINAYSNRLRELGAKSYVKHISIFRNYGVEAGASLSHAHSQIMATPMIPTTIQEELAASKTFHVVNGKCIFCDIMAQEKKGPRVVLENKHFFVFAPYASINPMEFWVFPKRHSANLSLKPAERTAFAMTLKTCLKALKDLLNDPPYNYGFHLALDSLNSEFYHWHLEVYPKLATWAGFEKSTGVFINTVTPETAAESLRKHIKF
jgi:UDPglucose--hexose-1-phosphate uridylyltransferase